MAQKISIILATLNSGEILEKSLKSVRSQKYNQKNIEIIAADGGSTDSTFKILKKYKAKIIRENTGSPEAAKSVALQYAKNEIILEIDCDNILPDKNWLNKMMAVFSKEKDIVGCYTLYYRHEWKDKPLNRYFALFGANDPVAYFLKKTDRQPHFYTNKKYSLAGEFQDKGDYFLVNFNKENMPTLGANGFLIKRKTLLKAQVDEKHFFHIDVNYDLINRGYNKYAVVKNDIFHASGESFWHYLKKRKRYMENLYLKDLSHRRFLLYKKERDRKKIILYSLYSLTVVCPTIEAIKGYLKVPDFAWFFHPLVCFCIFWIYCLSVINWQFWHHLGKIKKRFKI